jgi:hypothetical protein
VYDEESSSAYEDHDQTIIEEEEYHRYQESTDEIVNLVVVEKEMTMLTDEYRLSVLYPLISPLPGLHIRTVDLMVYPEIDRGGHHVDFLVVFQRVDGHCEHHRFDRR